MCERKYLQYMSSNGVTFVEWCLEVLYANSTLSIYSSQLSCSLFTNFIRQRCRVWLYRSTKPLVCGWYAVDTLCSILRYSSKCWLILLTNSLPWSDITIFVHPYLQIRKQIKCNFDQKIILYVPAYHFEQKKCYFFSFFARNSFSLRPFRKIIN